LEEQGAALSRGGNGTGSGSGLKCTAFVSGLDFSQLHSTREYRQSSRSLCWNPLDSGAAKPEAVEAGCRALKTFIRIWAIRRCTDSDENLRMNGATWFWCVGPCFIVPIKFYSSFIAHLEFYMDVFEYVSLSFQILCEEFEKRSLFTKGEGFSMLKQDLFGTRGFSSWEFSHLHRFLDSTFAASFV